jgi:homoserine kinase
VRVTVRVPATSANLGPGFDCFGLALDLCNEVTVDTEGEPGVSWEGEGAEELPTDGNDLASRTMAEAASDLGRPLPAMALHGVNRIPLERGLGSSAAASVAGAAVANALLDAPLEDEPYSTFEIASRIEGHPDNAAAAAYGGVTVVLEGVPRRLEPHPELRPVLLIPRDLRLSTRDARAVLPDPIPRADAVAQAASAAGLVIAITEDPRLLGLVMRDRLHEDARLALVPPARELRDRLRDAGVPVCVSGAGPSLLAFEEDDLTVPDPGDGWSVLRPGIRSRALEVVVEG